MVIQVQTTKKNTINNIHEASPTHGEKHHQLVIYDIFYMNNTSWMLYQKISILIIIIIKMITF